MVLKSVKISLSCPELKKEFARETDENITYADVMEEGRIWVSDSLTGMIGKTADADAAIDPSVAEQEDTSDEESVVGKDEVKKTRIQ